MEGCRIRGCGVTRYNGSILCEYHVKHDTASTFTRKGYTMPVAVTDESTVKEYQKHGSHNRSSQWSEVANHLNTDAEVGQWYEYVAGTDFEWDNPVDSDGNPVQAGERARTYLANNVSVTDTQRVSIRNHPEQSDRFLARVEELTPEQLETRRQAIEKAAKTRKKNGTSPGRKSNG